MNRQSLRVQWAQLVVLSSIHFLVDMFGNMLPAIVPVLRAEFAITLSTIGLIMAALSFASNGMQILTGRMRANKTSPFFLHAGLVLAATISLIFLAPKSLGGVALLIIFSVVSGSGIAVAHPEGLRAIHTLDRIPSTLTTAVFMTSGFFGFASGGMISALLVARYGLKGLGPLVVCPVAAIAALLASRVRLSTEDIAPRANGGRLQPEPGALPFWKVLGIGLPAAVSTTVIQQLTPTYLDELGFGLTFGGFSTALFGWGGGVGPFLWAAIAHRKGGLTCSTWAFFLSFPFTVLYLLFIRHPAAPWLLFGVGFSAMSAYILTITLARHAYGVGLGLRMALIVGGTWGIAMVVFLILAAIADRVGVGPILRLTPAGYLISGLLGFWLLRRHPEAVGRRRTMPAVQPSA
jgi:FSR family fosmidomycin resistance protein-like MFS transporter